MRGFVIDIFRVSGQKKSALSHHGSDRSFEASYNIRVVDFDFTTIVNRSTFLS